MGQGFIERYCMKMRKYATAAAALLLVCTTGLTGCAMNKDAKLATIFEGESQETISLGYGNFVAKYSQALYDETYINYFGEDMWSQDLYGEGNTFEEDVKSNVLEQIEESYLLKAHASEYDVTITDEEQEKIDQAAKDFMKNNSEEAIEQLGATEEYVKTMLTLNTYTQKMTSAIEAKADATVTNEEAAQRTFSYVEFNTQSTTDSSGNAVALTEDEVAMQKIQAETLATSADFDTTVTVLGQTASTYSYGADEDYSTMNEAVIKAADALSEGQVSDVIEVEGTGYYVIRLDKAYDEEATATKMESLAEEKKTDYYNDILDGWKKDDKWTVDKKQWAKVTFKNLFKAAETTNNSDTTDKTDTTTQE